MKIRTIYFKISDMAKAADFWKDFLGIEPHKITDGWHEFMVGTVRLALLLDDSKDKALSNCVPVFECTDDEISVSIKRAQKAGATIVFDGLGDPDIKSIVLADPSGNEFEISTFHD